MENKTTIQLVRNATLKIHYAGRTILVDPVFADKGTLQSALGVYKSPRVHLTMPISEIIKNVDMVLLTHNHIDHYDPSVPDYLAKDVPFFTQPQDKERIGQDGFTQVEAIEGTKRLGDMDIYRITGHHGFGKIGEIMGAVSGYILVAKGYPTIYIMGDCKWEESIRQVVNKFNPDYIVVNSGGAVFPEYSKVDGSIIPDEYEVMEMLRELPAHIKLMAVHMDAIDHCQTTREILRNEAKHQGIEKNRLIIPEDGECIQI